MYDNLEGLKFPLLIADHRCIVSRGWQRLGVRLEVIEAVFGHVSGSRRGIIGVYQRHKYQNEAREALAAWGAHVQNCSTALAEPR